MAGTGASSASAYGCYCKYFLSFVLALFALGIWCIISVVPASGSHCSGRLGVAYDTGVDFSGDDYFRGCITWLASGYMLCVSTLVALDEFHTFSTLRRTRILERSFSIRFEWKSVPSRCFWLQFCSARFALGKTGSTFASFTWLSCVMTDRFFRRSVRGFLASSSELRVHANSSRHLVVIHILSQSTRQKQQQQQPQHTTHNTQHTTHNTQHTTHNTQPTTHNTQPTTQHNATQRNATQRNATQRNATQRNATQHNTTQHNTTQHNTTQHNNTPTHQHNNTTPTIVSFSSLQQHTVEQIIDILVPGHGGEW